MTKRKAAHIIHHCYARLYKHSGKVKKDFAEDAIHEFRVDYKKLRAFLRMLQLKAKEPRDLKLPHSIKGMYATAGQVRDRQLCIKRIKADRQTSGIALKKMRQLRKEIKDISANATFVSKKEFENIETALIKSLPAVLSLTAGPDFVNQKLLRINAIIAKKEFGDKDLHDIRKGLKDIIFVTAMYENSTEESPAVGWVEDDVKQAAAMANELGSFNDAGIALSFLSPPEIRKAETGEGKHLWAIRRRWLAQKRKLKKEILPKLQAGNPALSART